MWMWIESLQISLDLLTLVTCLSSCIETYATSFSKRPSLKRDRELKRTNSKTFQLTIDHRRVKKCKTGFQKQ